eukprot:m51a1_g11799 hypothetical protein (439) ;mRNA; f:326563-327879
MFPAAATPEEPPTVSVILWNRPATTALGWCTPADTEPAAPLVQMLYSLALGGQTTVLQCGVSGEQVHLSARWDSVGSCLRQFLVAESLHSLGIPSERGLCVLATTSGAAVLRLERSPLRVAAFSEAEDSKLWEVCDLATRSSVTSAENRAQRTLSMVQAAVTRTACAIAEWQSLGFVHGSLCARSASLTGSASDVSTGAFMSNFSKDFAPTSDNGEHAPAFWQQPEAAYDILHSLATCVSSIVGEKAAEGALELFGPTLRAVGLDIMRVKLGLATWDPKVDHEMLCDLMELLEEDAVDHTDFWRCLSSVAWAASLPSFDPTSNALHPLLRTRVGRAIARLSPSRIAAWEDWLRVYEARIASDAINTNPEERFAAMNAVNPAFVPRAEALELAAYTADRGDFRVARTLYNALRAPFAEPTEETLALMAETSSFPGPSVV